MTKVATLAIIGILATSCGIQQVDNQMTRTGSNLKSVTINQPKFRETMDKDLSADLAVKADEMIKNLVVQISSEAVNCNSGLTADKKDFGEKKLSDASVDSSYKFKKGCDYVVKLVYIDSSSKAVILASDGKTVNLTKAELETAKPSAKVKMLVSEAGKKFWSKVPLLETPSETDASVDPLIDNGTGQQSLSAPVCPEVSALTRETGAMCLNDYRNFYSSAADGHKTAAWYAKYKLETANMVELPKSIWDDAEAKAKFCQQLGVNKNAVSQAIVAISGGSPSDVEAIFLSRLKDLTTNKYDSIHKAVMILNGCQ